MPSSDHYRALLEGAGLIDISSQRGRLWLEGADRRSYLQGLLTNDIMALTPGTGCYAAYLTAQGRMISDMRVFELGDALLVDLPAAVCAAVRSRWEMFIFSEDVKVEDRSGSTAELGVYGPRAADAVAAAFAAAGLPGSLPSATLTSMPLLACATLPVEGGPAIVLRSDEPGVLGFDLVVPMDAREQFASSLQENGAVLVDADVVEARRVESGRPRFGSDMTDDTIPLEAGIEDRAISLTKGCYVGQEIIIRVLHRGHGRVARRLVGLSFAASGQPPAHGATIRAADREVGAVTSAVWSPALRHPIALGYVHRDFTTPGTPLTVDGEAAVVAALPFV